MTHARRLAAALACLLGAAPLPVMALAPEQASLAAPDDESVILASPRWREVVGKLRDVALHPVDEGRLRSACHDALAAAGAAVRYPEEVCLDAAILATGSPGHYFPAGRVAGLLPDGAKREFVGIGLELDRKSAGGPLPIVRAIAGSPAARAHLQPGDLILRVDGHDLLPLTSDGCIEVMRGAAGTPMTLEIERGPSHDRLTIVAVRARIGAVTVKIESLSTDVAAVRLGRFAADTPADLVRRLVGMLHVWPTPPGALLVDLRGNAGGDLDAMREIAGDFADPDTIAVRQLTRAGESALAVSGEPPPTGLPDDARRWLRDVRIAVLVDERTANAAEAFALFLREQRGARILGRQTAGRATTDRMLALADGGVLQVQAGELRSARHVAWQGKGIVPDVELLRDTAGRDAPEAGTEADANLAEAIRLLLAP